MRSVTKTLKSILSNYKIYRFKLFQDKRLSSTNNWYSILCLPTNPNLKFFQHPNSPKARSLLDRQKGSTWAAIRMPKRIPGRERLRFSPHLRWAILVHLCWPAMLLCFHLAVETTFAIETFHRRNRPFSESLFYTCQRKDSAKCWNGKKRLPKDVKKTCPEPLIESFGQPRWIPCSWKWASWIW